MTQTCGAMLRSWRERRRLSQLDLANRADVSARHLSYLENGRSRPSSAMILRLCEHLDIPLREQNKVLLAGGYAPAHAEHALTDPPLRQANQAIEQILAAHQPWPALVVDRGWDLVSANDAIYRLVEGVDPALLEPPVNVIRLALDPRGLAARTVNLDEWRAHLLARIAREYDQCGDERLALLLKEFGPVPSDAARNAELVISLQLRAGDDVLSFISATTVFGTPHEVTLSELAIETFYPADDETRRLVAG
ncbi:helix-turn-helix domain-containing protein [Luteipulveratus halotolerans]|uniref:XRE family transcriptional regulator n=1 Tax=Luteipulveratus halotolerans TaxID=1631356 RepID=A0A0L6CMH0_9MICO|nr:helix-turn-helix transcriptional regulator [Luteipulveratus halotolerans]KNX38966.1 XRE family transcriptional regulator [Luteipulveratus halotolerans]